MLARGLQAVSNIIKPGSWAIDDDTINEEGDFAVVFIEGGQLPVDGIHIATVMGPGNWPCLDGDEARERAEKQIEETANLIAAAPDLLALLEEFVEADDGEWHGPLHADRMDRAHAAIKKARGE